jgi:hypothetical protein
MTCPRCGRTFFQPGVTVCADCGATLVPWPPASSPERTLKVRVAPILKQALTSVKPGEDFDEALLRELKARYPDQAAGLLGACTRLIEIEAKRASASNDETIRRLAQTDPGPEITLTFSGDESPRVLAQTRVIRVGDKEYGSLEDLPPGLRRAVERAQRGVRPQKAPRLGCTWGLIANWLVGLLHLAGK